jgi:glycosyltransferase involved in cell wall biosynthesis
MYHLEKAGCSIAWAGRKTTARPLRLKHRIDDFRPDIVYTYGAVTSLNPVLLRSFCRHDKYQVVHGWDDAYGDVWSDSGWLARKVMDILERLIVTRSDHVITLSYFLQNRGRKWGVECKYIPNGADPVDASQATGEIVLDGALKLVYTGDKAHWKRTHEICEAMRHVPKEIKLYLTGQDNPELAQYASDNCIFLGFLPKEEQLNVMRQADVFVCTANQDCNAKLQEYLRWHKPILGYDDRANLFFKNGENALLTRDYPAAIMTLYHDPELRQRLADNAARDIPVYSWTEIAEQFLEYFKEIGQE